ncbi:hypothetical protein H9Y04_43450 [Streptomyces sp. TRM66268-LWL]|uniref:Sigma-70 family RNA polymerase sigma factor n=1 Tax=Streptomyces polyasparticus TaxID=2767826 RepID=A0ABR7SVG4_9ACTN|nr:hypothetical protein [Streptomyces polyasparticus]MBC9719388.1 hypothetical protein [Streptomyces polyasparticus]
MHHRHRSTPHPQAASSPLEVLDDAFLALARAPHPLTLPAQLVCTQPSVDDLPVDQVRARLVHPSTPPGKRLEVWREVIRRSHTLGDPWTTVALAMAVPALRRQLARLPRPLPIERAEAEQEALAALVTLLQTLPVDHPELDWALLRAADRAVHRVVYAARRRIAHETPDAGLRVGRLHGTRSADRSGSEHEVLVRAVRARVVDIGEAQLIARSRLHGVHMRQLAAERGLSLAQLYRHRGAAEQRLAEHLQAQDDGV